MLAIPHAVLSEEFEEALAGKRLLAAVFVTFQFDPDFFETQVLPVFLGVPLSHADVIRRVQLEDALRDVPHRLAVYYDQNGLDAEAKSARLDIARVPMIHRTGIFHPKNVFALVEELDPEDGSEPAQSLIVACLSANLTRSGWWENVEVAHIETIEEGEWTRLKDDLYRFLEGIESRASAKAGDDQASIQAIKRFLRRTEQIKVRSYKGLFPHFFNGATSVPEFLDEIAGPTLRGLNLEIISPYFDSGPESKPLLELIAWFQPREVRLFLPKKESGEALCTPELYQWVAAQPGVSWARLPAELLKGGRSGKATARGVHAKVYRFFQAQPKREFLFVGSVNLTGPAHRRGGNLESGFLVELDPPRRPDWWLEPERSRPAEFAPQSEDEGAATAAGSRLSLRFNWGPKKGFEAYWDDAARSPDLRVFQAGVPLFEIEPFPEKQWTPLPEAAAAAAEVALRSGSIFLVEGDRPEPAAVLVQEEGMAQRPSLLFDLSPAEILRYWSLLTREQRSAFLEAHALALAGAGEGEGADLIAAQARLAPIDTFFDRFAGIFLSFGQLERTVREAIEKGNERSAEYRLFGQKYDSLGHLLSRIAKESTGDEEQLTEHYVMALCARQMIGELRRDHPDFFKAHREELNEVEEALKVVETLRRAIAEGAERPLDDFLAWFESWFLRRAKPVEVEAGG